MIPLYLAYDALWIEFYKLRILIGREDMEILSLKEPVQILIRFPYRRLLRSIQKGGNIAPALLTRRKGILHTGKGSFKSILFCKFSKIFLKGRRISIIKISAARCGKTGSSPCYHAVRLFQLPQQSLYLLFVGQCLFVRKLIRCFSRRVYSIISGIVHLCLGDQIFVKAHGDQPLCLGVIFTLTAYSS